MKKFLIGTGALLAVGAAVGIYLYKKSEKELDDLDIDSFDDDIESYDDDIASEF